MHSEKMLSDTKVRVDFYVYCPDGNFAIDIFYSGTMRNLQSNVNIKVGKYKNHYIKIYLVSANENITQERLDNYLKARVSPLSNNIQLVSLATFLTTIKDMNVYKNPIKK